MYIFFISVLSHFWCVFFFLELWDVIFCRQKSLEEGKGKNCNIFFLYCTNTNTGYETTKACLGPVLWIEWRHLHLCGILCFSFLFIMFILCLLLFSLRSSCLHFFACSRFFSACNSTALCLLLLLCRIFFLISSICHSDTVFAGSGVDVVLLFQYYCEHNMVFQWWSETKKNNKKKYSMEWEGKLNEAYR